MTPPALWATSPASLGGKQIPNLTPDAAHRVVAAQQAVEILDRLGETLLERDLGLPLELVARQGDVGAALQGIVDRQRPGLDELRLAADQLYDLLGEMPDRHLDRIAEIDRTGEIIRRVVHQTQPAIDQVVDVAEGAGLHAVAVDRDVFALERLNDEVRHPAAAVGGHARPVGVEDTRHLDAQFVLAVVVEEQRFGAALALVVAGARPQRIDVAAIALDLRMHGGIAVDLAGRGLEDLGARTLGQAEHIDGAVHAGLGRLHRIVLVVNRRGRTSEVVDLVDLDIERERHVVAHQLEAWIVQAGRDI